MAPGLELQPEARNKPSVLIIGAPLPPRGCSPISRSAGHHRRVRDTDDTPRSFLSYAAIGTYVSDRRVATLDEPAIRAEVIERVARIRRELGLPVDP